MFGGAGLGAGITVGALLAQQMLGTDAFAGLPTAMFRIGISGFHSREAFATIWTPNRSCNRVYSRRIWSNWCCNGGF